MESVSIVHYSGKKLLNIGNIKHDHAVAIKDYVASINYTKNPTREGFKNILGFVIGQLKLARSVFLSFEKISPSSAITIPKPMADQSAPIPVSRDLLIKSFGRALAKGVWFG